MKPRRLYPGARIGIVNPAYWLEPERQQRTTSVFESLGYEIAIGNSTRLKMNRFAGSPEERADDIMTMFIDPSIDAIIAARGGYGGNRVLPLLDYGEIARNPKIFVGYSDITGFLASIVLEVCDGLDIPIVSNFSCGHGDYQATLPVAHPIGLHAVDESPRIRVPEAPVT